MTTVPTPFFIVGKQKATNENKNKKALGNAEKGYGKTRNRVIGEEIGEASRDDSLGLAPPPLVALVPGCLDGSVGSRDPFSWSRVGAWIRSVWGGRRQCECDGWVA